MSEIELLRKIVIEAIKSRNLKRRYDHEMREYQRKFPLADSRCSKAAIASRKQKTDPIYEKLKESKRKLEGFLFIYECRDWDVI